MIGRRKAALEALAVLGAVTALVATLAGSASAATNSSTVTSPVAVRELRDLVRNTPGARQLTDRSVELKPGVVVTSLTQRSAVTPFGAPTQCPESYVCMYSNAQDPSHGGGYMLAVFSCGRYDLGQLDFPGGGKWNDKISAVYNHHHGNVAADWYNYGGGMTWYLEASQDQGHYLLNLADNGINDIIDGVDTCDQGPIYGWSPTDPVSSMVQFQRGV